MKKKWVVYGKRAPFQEIAASFGIDQVTARVIRNRDVIGAEAVRKYLQGTTEDLYDPKLLKGTADAAALLEAKIRDRKRIRVIGDYDIDGVCATYILISVLEELGAQVDYEIPDRIKDGYGLHEGLVEEAAANGIDTILTCDNGITAIEAISLAKELGMDVIVTDHHQPRRGKAERDGSNQTDECGRCSGSDENDGKEAEQILPPANILVDPHLQGETYPYHDICGAVVAWKLMQVLCDRMADERASGLCESMLVFAAVATVGDVMDLKDENRIIVKYGLRELQRTKHIGLRSLIRATGLEGKQLGSYHVGFVIGPCINAGGRLDTAKKALELLRCHDETEAAAMAWELTSLNGQRKELTQQGFEQAVRILESSSTGAADQVYVLYLPGCHESIAGIIAGKIREKYYHPVFILTDGAAEGQVKGSGRSIEGYVMHEELEKCADLLDNYGGHPMAAGVRLKKENVQALRERLNENCTLTPDAFVEKQMIDAAMPISYVTPKLIGEMSVIEPCGKGNEKPVFAQKDVPVLSIRVVGKDRKIVKLQLMADGAVGQGRKMEGVYFGDPEAFLEDLKARFGKEVIEQLLTGRGMPIPLSILYYPEINEYRGYQTVQIVIKDYLV